MRSVVLVAMGAACAIMVSAAPVEAQAVPPRPPTLALDCRADNVRTLTDEEIGPVWLASHPDRLFARIQPLMIAGAWGAAMDSVMLRNRATLGFADASTRARYAERLTEAHRLFGKLLKLPVDQQSRFVADSLRPTQWQLNPSPVAAMFTVFAGTLDVVVSDTMSSDKRRALCWPAISINRLLTVYRAPARDATVEALNTLAARWDDYIDNSYSQLPWELFLNGLSRSRRDWEPPRNQWILVHPSVGVEIAGLSWKNLNRVDVAVVEPLGYLRYNANYTRYVGVSGVATFASNRAAAIGGYLHLWYPQAKIGYVVRPDPDRKRRRSVLVTVDLYDFLTGVPKSVSEAKDAALALRKEQPVKP